MDFRTQVDVTADRVTTIARFLDRPDRVWRPGDKVPLMWHFFFALPSPSQRSLGPDGHPARHDGAYDARRMFAGGKVTFHAGLTVGDRLQVDDSEPADVSIRQSVDSASRRVTTRTHLDARDRRLLTDERRIVYLSGAPRTAATGATAPSPASDEWSPARAVPLALDPVVLFRFSALTYNAHRIHYDVTYAREVEGYPALVVHGPLQALMMAEASVPLGPEGEPASFDYTLVAPLFVHDDPTIQTRRNGDTVAARIVTRDGRTTARGEIRWQAT